MRYEEVTLIRDQNHNLGSEPRVSDIKRKGYSEKRMVLSHFQELILFYVENVGIKITA